MFAYAHQVKKVPIPDETNHFHSVSYPHTCINIKQVTCNSVQLAVELRAVRLSYAVGRRQQHTVQLHKQIINGYIFAWKICIWVDVKFGYCRRRQWNKSMKLCLKLFVYISWLSYACKNKTISIRTISCPIKKFLSRWSSRSHRHHSKSAGIFGRWIKAISAVLKICLCSLNLFLISGVLCVIP